MMMCVYVPCYNVSLEDKGFVVKTAHDATQMDRLLQRELFSLIVLDFMLPVEDGLSICRRFTSI